MAVAVPPTVRPLPMEKTLGQRVHAFVRDPERHHRVERVALLRGAAAVAAAPERNTPTPGGLRLGARRGIPGITGGEAEPHDATAGGGKAPVPLPISRGAQA